MLIFNYSDKFNILAPYTLSCHSMLRKVFIFCVFISTLLSGANAIQRQRAQNWCWASCVQDVIRQAGISQSQIQVAAVLDGWPRDRPAYIQELVALFRYYGLNSWQAGRPGTPQELYSSLSSGWKLVAFARPSNGPVGHYIILQGFDHRTGAVIVSDPWTGITYPSSLDELYNGWRWSDSIIIGAPQRKF